MASKKELQRMIDAIADSIWEIKKVVNQNKADILSIKMNNLSKELWITIIHDSFINSIYVYKWVNKIKTRRWQLEDCRWVVPDTQDVYDYLINNAETIKLIPTTQSYHETAQKDCKNKK